MRRVHSLYSNEAGRPREIILLVLYARLHVVHPHISKIPWKIMLRKNNPTVDDNSLSSHIVTVLTGQEAHST